MQQQELKHCPFCGAVPIYRKFDGQDGESDKERIECANCGAEIEDYVRGKGMCVSSRWQSRSLIDANKLARERVELLWRDVWNAVRTSGDLASAESALAELKDRHVKALGVS